MADRIHDHATRGDHTNDGAKRLSSTNKEEEMEEPEEKPVELEEIALPEDLVGAKTSECLIELEVSV